MQIQQKEDNTIIMTVLENLQTSVTALNLKVDELCANGRFPKKVTNSLHKTELAIKERGRISRKDLQRIVGSSESQMSRDLKELEARGKITRQVSSTDSRMRECIWNDGLERQNINGDDIAVLDLIMRCPQLSFEELRRKAGSAGFGLSYAKLLAHGLAESVHDNGRLYTVVTRRGQEIAGGGQDADKAADS